jgi:putative SOS response-associated peptidase YedK
MCRRFARRSTREVLAEWFGVDLEDAPPFAPSYNVAPQSVQPVVRLGRDDSKPEFALLRWGLVPFWAKDAKIGYSTINARSEEVASKPAFRDALHKRRCLVPADAFYEWERSDPKNKRPFAFALKSGEPMHSPDSGKAGVRKKASRWNRSRFSRRMPMRFWSRFTTACR